MPEPHADPLRQAATQLLAAAPIRRCLLLRAR
jgi:hypothetical protein